MPCTGVLIRTSVNYTSGATHKMSQLINAIVVCAFALLLMPYFSYIPMSVVASILITSACRLVPKKFIYQTFQADKSECFICILTTFACVCIDGAIGLLIGCLLSLMKTAVRTENPNYKIDTEDGITTFKVVGGLNFINSMKLEEIVESEILKEENKDKSKYQINLKNNQNFDFDALLSCEAIETFNSTKTIYWVIEQIENGEDILT